MFFFEDVKNEKNVVTNLYRHSRLISFSLRLPPSQVRVHRDQLAHFAQLFDDDVEDVLLREHDLLLHARLVVLKFTVLGFCFITHFLKYNSTLIRHNCVRHNFVVVSERHCHMFLCNSATTTTLTMFVDLMTAKLLHNVNGNIVQSLLMDPCIADLYAIK